MSLNKSGAGSDAVNTAGVVQTDIASIILR